MSEYRPDKWVVIKITGPDTPPIHKIFACWYGGYLDGDSWKLNSGITKATLKGFAYYFEGSSGSVYECQLNCYGTNMYGHSVLNNLIDRIEKADGKVEILPEETNWLEINYE